MFLNKFIDEVIIEVQIQHTNYVTTFCTRIWNRPMSEFANTEMNRYKKLDLDLLLNPLFHGPHEELKGMTWNNPLPYYYGNNGIFSTHSCPECDSEHEQEATNHVIITEVVSPRHNAPTVSSQYEMDETCVVLKKKKKKKKKDTGNNSKLVPEIIFYKDDVDDDVDDVRASFEAYEPVYVVNALPKLPGVKRSNTRRRARSHREEF